MDYKHFRICGDTPLSELMHTYESELAYIDIDEADDVLFHWGWQKEDHKYLKREKVNGKWRYWYKEDESENTVKNVIGNAKDRAKRMIETSLNRATNRAISDANKFTSKLDSTYNAVKKSIDKFYDDPDNIYNVTRSSYTKKLEEIKKTDEWKKITSDAKSEYAKKDKNGNVTYDIDEYLVDKKHPVMDAIGDIMAGRPITTLEITKDSAVAGLKDYATSAIEIGMLSVGCVANGLSRKFKYSQGSYDDDIESLVNTVNDGAEYVSDVYDITSTYAEAAAKTSREYDDDVVSTVGNIVSGLSSNLSESDLRSAATAAISGIYPDMDKSDAEILVNNVLSDENIAKTKNTVEALMPVVTTATEAAKEIREDNVVAAAQTIVESDAIKDQLGTDEYYQQAETILTDLSEEEIQLINLLIAQMRSGK